MLYAVPTPAAEIVSDFVGILAVAAVVVLAWLCRPRRHVPAEPHPVCIMPRHAPAAPPRVTKIGTGILLTLPQRTMERRRRPGRDT